MANAFNQFSEGYNQGQDMAQGFARQQAGNSLANGDYGGAANTLYRSGQLDTGSSVQNFGQAQHKQEVADRLEFFGKAAAALAQIPDDGTQTARKAALAHLTPTFQAMGMKPQNIQQLQSADLSNASLSAFGANLAKQLELIKGQDGELGTWNAATGTYNQIRAGTPKPFEMDPAKNYVVPDNGQSAAAPTAEPASAPNADAVWARIKQREWGGTGPAPDSPQGAQGSTQMLPATAQSMAAKLGVAWRPDLMRGNSPEALAYQDKLGRAYFDEGVQKYGGDLAKGASYYHGGPNERIWGPKTRAYAQAVAGQGAGPALQGGAGGDNLSPEIPGYRYIQRAQASADDSALDPQTVDLLAGRYLKDGTLPALGMGKAAAANRSAILKAASAKAKELGINADDLVAGTVSVKAGASALQKVAGTTELIRASEQTVEKNLKIALNLAQKVNGPTGVPVLNRWIQAGRKNIAGDADVAALNQAVGTVADEYAKVMTTTNGAGAGMTSDSARQEAYRRINSAMTPQQLQAVIGVMRQEMQNRLASYQETQTGILNAIRGTNSANPQASGAAPSAAQASAAPADQPKIRRYNPATGRLE